MSALGQKQTCAMQNVMSALAMDVPLSEQTKSKLMGFVFALLTILLSPAHAEEPFSASVLLKDHRFDPAELHVPAGRHILLHLKNDDPTSEEFDSSALRVEKVFSGNSEGLIRISPLSPGRYEFMGEYHSDTAKGVVIAE